MASPPKKTVSEIPTLKGERNIGDWIRGLNEVLKAHDLQHYISTQPGPLIKTKENKEIVAAWILGTTYPVKTRYELRRCFFVSDDPAIIYQTICNTISTPSNFAKHVAAVHRRFSELQPAQFADLGRYRMAVTRRKHDLSKMGSPINETLACWIVINALEADYPDLHHQLAKDMAAGAGNLDWEELLWKMNEVGPEHGYDVGRDIEVDTLLPSDGDNGDIVDQLE
jgi:hypothetical protein